MGWLPPPPPPPPHASAAAANPHSPHPGRGLPLPPSPGAGPTLYPKEMVSEQPEKFFVAEIVREQIFLQYEEEVPYSTQARSWLAAVGRPPARVPGDDRLSTRPPASAWRGFARCWLGRACLACLVPPPPPADPRVRCLAARPPACPQVHITQFKERRGAKDFVGATVFVERESQKGILVGAGGGALKRLGSASRWVSLALGRAPAAAWAVCVLLAPAQRRVHRPGLQLCRCCCCCVGCAPAGRPSRTSWSGRSTWS